MIDGAARGSPTDEGRHGAIFQQNWQLAIDPERLVRDLSSAERKLVQMPALIDGAARLVVFDEPTAPGRGGGQSGLLRYPAPARPGHCHSVFPTTSMR